jgi:hypothetical protein
MMETSPCRRSPVVMVVGHKGGRGMMVRPSDGRPCGGAVGA